MLILQNINEIEQQKTDVPLYYITSYKGIASFIDEKKKEKNISISFSLEMESTGNKKIDIQFNEDINYPLMPLIKMLKEKITILDQEGKLPW